MGVPRAALLFVLTPLLAAASPTLQWTVDDFPDASVVRMRKVVRSPQGTLYWLGEDDAHGYIARVLATGAVQWQRSFGADGGTLSPLAAVVDKRNSDVYLAGWSINQTLTGADCGPSYTGLRGAFVARLDGNTGATVWSRCIDGPNADQAYGLAFDVRADGGATLAVGGITRSDGFGTAGVWQQSSHGAGNDDGFAARIDPDDGGIMWFTYVGGAGDDAVSDLVFHNNAVFVTGDGFLESWPAVGGLTLDAGNSRDIYLLKLDVDTGEALSLGAVRGEAEDDAHALLIAQTGDLIVGGQTYSSNFGALPFPTQLFPNRGAGSDGLVVAFNQNAKPQWATYIPGGSEDSIQDLASGSTRVFAVGKTTSLDLSTRNAFQANASNLIGDGLIAAFELGPTPVCTSLGYFGGTGIDAVLGATYMPNADSLLVAGTSTSGADFPGSDGGHANSAHGFVAALTGWIVDAGVDGGEDAGVDAGTDAGPVVTPDAGVDAGAADSGAPVVDGGPSVTEAGTDAGGGSDQAPFGYGCNCSSVPLSAFGLLFAFAGFARLKSRRR